MKKGNWFELSPHFLWKVKINGPVWITHIYAHWRMRVICKWCAQKLGHIWRAFDADILRALLNFKIWTHFHKINPFQSCYSFLKFLPIFKKNTNVQYFDQFQKFWGTSNRGTGTLNGGAQCAVIRGTIVRRHKRSLGFGQGQANFGNARILKMRVPKICPLTSSFLYKSFIMMLPWHSKNSWGRLRFWQSAKDSEATVCSGSLIGTSRWYTAPFHWWWWWWRWRWRCRGGVGGQ